MWDALLNLLTATGVLLVLLFAWVSVEAMALARRGHGGQNQNKKDILADDGTASACGTCGLCKIEARH